MRSLSEIARDMAAAAIRLHDAPSEGKDAADALLCEAVEALAAAADPDRLPYVERRHLHLYVRTILDQYAACRYSGNVITSTYHLAT